MKKYLFVLVLAFIAHQLFAQYDVNQIYIRIQKGESRELVNELSPLLKDTTFKETEVLMVLGDAWKSQFDHNKALQSYRRVLQLDSSNKRAMESASDMYSLLGEVGSAKKLLVKLSKSDTSNVRILNKLAQTMQSMQEIKEAANIYNRLLKVGGANYNTVKSLADCYWLLGDSERAEFNYKIADVLNGKSLATKLSLSQIAFINKDLSSAKIYASRGVDLDSTYMPLRKQLAIVHYKLEEYKLALANFSYLISKGDSSSNVFKFAGACNFFMGEFERAIPLLNEVLLKDSVDTEAMFYLASSLSHSGKSQEAADIFNEILSLLQPDPALLYKLYNQLGIAYSALNKLQESYDYFNQAYKLNSEDSKLLFQMAMVRGGFKEKGSLIEARSLLEQYLKAIKPKGDNLTAEETILKERAKMYIERLKEEIFMSE